MLDYHPCVEATRLSKQHLFRMHICMSRGIWHVLALHFHVWFRKKSGSRSKSIPGAGMQFLYVFSLVWFTLMLFCSQSKIQVMLPGKSAKARRAAETWRQSEAVIWLFGFYCHVTAQDETNMNEYLLHSSTHLDTTRYNFIVLHCFFRKSCHCSVNDVLVKGCP